MSIVNLTWHPNRVLVDDGGTLVHLKVAKEMGVDIDIIFIRPDGYSIGAPSYLEGLAYALWSWDRYTTKDQPFIFSIDEYHRSRSLTKQL